MKKSLLCYGILHVIVIYGVRKKVNLLSLFTTYYPLFMLCVLSVLYVMYRIQPLASTVKNHHCALCVNKCCLYLLASLLYTAA